MNNLSITQNDWVSVVNNTVTTTSMQVSQFFGKRHDDVLKKIRALDCSADFNARNFAAVDYRDAKGELRPMWEMTKDGFMFLVMGFTGKKAAKVKEAYINAFNWMADQLASERAAALPAPQTSMDVVSGLNPMDEIHAVDFFNGDQELAISVVIDSLKATCQQNITLSLEGAEIARMQAEWDAARHIIEKMYWKLRDIEKLSAKIPSFRPF